MAQIAQSYPLRFMALRYGTSKAAACTEPLPHLEDPGNESDLHSTAGAPRPLSFAFSFTFSLTPAFSSF